MNHNFGFLKRHGRPVGSSRLLLLSWGHCREVARSEPGERVEGDMKQFAPKMSTE